MPNIDWLAELKVVELKEECKKRGLAVSGKKAELVERLEEYIAENEKIEQPAVAGEPAAAEEEQAPEAAAAAEEAEGEPAEAAQPEDEAAAPAAAEPEPEQQQASPAAEPEPEQQPAPMEEDQQAAEPAAPHQQQEAAAAPAAAAAAAPAAAADVDLDYGEESDGEPAAAPAEAVAATAAAEEAEPQAGGKRRRDEPQAEGGTPASAATPRASAMDKNAAAAAIAAARGSADRPTKVARTSLGNAEKGAVPAPEDVPAASEPTTRALRIDGFVRPFTERQVRELLNETGQVVALWMPSIKTHCYAVMESQAQAEATRRATYQLQWPATNPKRLAPRFVPLSEAETAIGNGAGNPDFRVKRTEEDAVEEGPPAAAAAAAPAAAAVQAKPAAAAAAAQPAEGPGPDRSQREWNRNRRSPSPSPLEGVRDLREMLSRRVSGRGSDAAAAPAGAAPAGPAAAGMVPPGMGLPAERRVHERERERGPARQPEDRVLTLDELFNKTAAKPCIYWLPLTDAQVAEKKSKAAEAAAAAAAAAAAGPAGAVGPAGNGTTAAAS